MIVVRLWVPRTHSQLARHWNCAASRRVGERLPGAAQRFDVHAVVDGRGVGLGHGMSFVVVSHGGGSVSSLTPLSVDHPTARVLEDG